MIRQSILAACFFGLCGAAHAQQPQPYVPFTVDENNFKALQTYLGEHPAKFSMALVNWLNNMEAKAVADKAAADKAFEQKPEKFPTAPVGEPKKQEAPQ